MKRSSDIYCLPRGKRCWQNNFYNIYMLRMIFYGCGYIIYFKIKPVDVTLIFFIGEIEFGAAVFQHLVGKSSFIIFISIDPQVKPDKFECVGRIVGVVYFFKTI